MAPRRGDLGNEQRPASSLTLLGRVDFRRGSQCSSRQHRIESSTRRRPVPQPPPASTINRIVIDHKLYWATVASVDEGRYLTAILNSPALTRLITPMQSRGEHNPRDFDKYVWRLPIPLFDPSNGDHVMIAELGGLAEAFVAQLELAAEAVRDAAPVRAGGNRVPSRRSVGRSTSA